MCPEMLSIVLCAILWLSSVIIFCWFAFFAALLSNYIFSQERLSLIVILPLHIVFIKWSTSWKYGWHHFRGPRFNITEWIFEIYISALYQTWISTHREHFLNRSSLWKARASVSEFQLKSSRFHFGIWWNLCQNFPDSDRVKKSSHFKNTILTASTDSTLPYEIGSSVEP